MSSVTSLRGRLQEGVPAFTAWCGLPDPSVAALLAREDFDAVTLDLQHGAIDFAAAIQAIPLIAAAGKPAIARLPVGQYATASRLLDAGVSALIAPMINTLEDARRFGSFVKYPPVGERSWGPHGAVALTKMTPAQYFADANGFSLALAMIETRDGLSIIDDILAAPEIDGIFVGPTDLSIALSNGTVSNALSAEVLKALEHVLARARAAKKPVAIYAHSGERAAELAKQGFDLIAVAGDAVMLRAGAQAALQAARR